MKNWVANTLIVIGALVAIFVWSWLWYSISNELGLSEDAGVVLGFLWGIGGGIPIRKAVGALWRSDY